jgi:DNA polymerase-4
LEKIKKIIHIDMDYFYAQVEEREKPALKSRPVGVGGTSSRRGILCTCNYVARKYGVRSAMATFEAVRRCPDIILIKPNFHLYQEASEKIFNIFSQYTDVVEGISLDEAYLDVTNVSKLHNSATLIAKEIKLKILKETGLTASAGISYNKLFSKIASEFNKPNGLLTITPEMAKDFSRDLPINLINGVGKKTYQKMKELNLYTFKDVQKLSILECEHYFGSYGRSLFNYAHGVDHREVQNSRERKSLSVERTFMKNFNNLIEMNSQVIDIHNEMIRRLEKHKHRKVKTIFIKLKFHDFTQTTMEISSNSYEIEKFLKLLEEKYTDVCKSVRLIGVGVKFQPDEHFSKQLFLPCCA